MKARPILVFVLIVLLVAACAPVPAPAPLPASNATAAQPAAPAPMPAVPPAVGAPAVVPAGWQVYTNPAGFAISYPATWSQKALPQQAGETIHTVTLQGLEGGVDLHWGVGFGGACPQGYTTVKVAQGELPACYGKRADGTEVWTQIGKQLEATSFSADAHTNNADPASHDLVMQVLSTLSFPPPEQSAGGLTARMLTAPNALAGPSPSSFNWSPAGAVLAYVEPQEGQNMLWLYNAATEAKRLLLDPTKSPGNIDLTSAQWSPQGDRLLFAGDEALWLLDVKTGNLKSLAEGGSAKTGLMFTPDGTRLSFVQDNNLSVVRIDDGQIQRLTSDGGETVFNGSLDWVYNEELATRAAQPAYAWSPDSNWLIYLRLDESTVHQDPVTDYRPVPATVSYTRYPTAGTPNPMASLHALTPGALAPPLEIPLPPDAEYVLPLFTWTLDSNTVLYITVNRDHTELALNAWTPQSGETRTLVKETDPNWINEDRYAAPIFLGDGSQFLWISEHLYLYTRKGELVRKLTQGDWMIDSTAWNLLIAGRPVHANPAGTWAYLTTTRTGPLERQIDRVNVTTGQLEQVSQQPGFHLSALSADGRYLVDQFSDVNTPPITRIVKTDGSGTKLLAEASGPALALPRLSREFVTLKAHDGVDLYAQLVKPANFDPSRKYPVVVHWYGGPGLQMVSNRYGTTNIFNIIERDVLYTQEGMLVWRLDNRGSFGRGHAFETPIFGQLGPAALDDQLAGFEYLKSLPYVDAARIGTDGKSFGGYMTLYALLHAPDVFRCGVAGAAPTDWSYYDTIYTERYMRTPDKNPEGYAATNLIAKAGQIRARPLLIHGLADTNVHLQNTVNFIQALEAADKPFNFIPLPNLSHSFRGEGLVAALSASADYLAACLTAGPAAQAAAAAQPAATVQSVAIPATPAAAGSTLQPLNSQACAELAHAMANTLGVQVTQSEAPFTDPSTGQTGTGCQATATGTGEQFASPNSVVNELAGVLESQDWQEDPKLAAGGPTGIASGFRKGNQVCIASARWQPAASAKCPNDQPISACQVVPKQQLYTVTLACAQSTT
jgi:dipeptidyl-peptidase-4